MCQRANASIESMNGMEQGARGTEQRAKSKGHRARSVQIVIFVLTFRL